MKHRTTIPAALMILALLAAGCQGSRGTGPELSFVGALGATDLEGEGAYPDEPIIDGPNFSGRFAFGIESNIADVDDRGSGPRIAGRFGISYTREDLDGRIVAGEPLLTIEDFVGLNLYTPQAALSYRQQVAGNSFDGGFFIEPGLAAGPVIGSLAFGSDLEYGNYVVGTDIEERETEVGLGVQPFLRAAFDTGEAVIGAEGGYLWTNLDFDHDLGRDAEEWYLGLYLGIRF